MDEQSSEMERITARIQQVQFAKALMSRGAHPEALQVLRSVRSKYQDDAMLRMIDWLIRDTEAKVQPPPGG